MTATATRLGPLSQVSLLSRDIARSETFYRDTLGLDHLYTFGALAFFDCGGVRLYVHAVSEVDWRPGSILYFRVEDIDAAFEELTAKGVRFVGRPHLIHRHASGDEEWMAAFSDPDDNVLELMATVSAAERREPLAHGAG